MASTANGAAANACAWAGVKRPPCSARLSVEAGLSAASYRGSTAQRWRLAATCRAIVLALADVLAVPIRAARGEDGEDLLDERRLAQSTAPDDG